MAARSIRRALVGAVSTALALSLLGSARAEELCRDVRHLGEDYVVCTFSPHVHRIDMHLTDGDDEPFGSIAALERADVPFAFAMNGGMYRDDLSPVGLYVEGGEERTRLVTRDGWGNFHLLPNGVFAVIEDGKGGQGWSVRETLDFSTDPPDGLIHATQSGPMLVIDGALHPRFLPRSDSLKVRNGVGVDAEGRAHFAISRGRVRFHDFGTLFRDVLETPNALFLDGTISTFRAGDRRQGGWREVGPIITARPIEADEG